MCRHLLFDRFVAVFLRSKRVAATFALLAVTLAFLFMIVLVGLIGNTVQTYIRLTEPVDTDPTQFKLLIAILSIGAFVIVLCMIFFLMYGRVFFARSARRLLKQ